MYSGGHRMKAALYCIPTVITQRQSEKSAALHYDQMHIQTSIITTQDEFAVGPSHLQHGAGQMSIPYSMGALLRVVHTDTF